jgi:hypothetical protein
MNNTLQNNNNQQQQQQQQDIVFSESKERFFRCIFNQHYLLQITKCCDHFEWITILKTYTCNDLYRYLREFYENPKTLQLFAKDDFGNKLEISESDCPIKKLIFTNGNFFKPVYPLPYQVVYKLFIDDGHTH